MSNLDPPSLFSLVIWDLPLQNIIIILRGITNGPQLIPTSSLCVQSDVAPQPGCLHDEIWMLLIPQSRLCRSILPVPGPYDLTVMSLPLEKKQFDIFETGHLHTICHKQFKEKYQQLFLINETYCPY